MVRRLNYALLGEQFVSAGSEEVTVVAPGVPVGRQRFLNRPPPSGGKRGELPGGCTLRIKEDT